MPAILEFHRVSGGYHPDRDVIRDCSLELGPGLHVLLAPNGAGKTTFLRLAAGILEPARGTVRILGHPARERPEVKRRVGYVSHRVGLYPQLTLHENLRFWGMAGGIFGDELENRIAELCEQFHMKEFIHRKYHILSRGQAQKGALARALLGRPSLLLLDEPTAGLDVEAAAILIEEARSLARSGTAIIYSTHRIEDNALLADSTIYIDRGRVDVETYGPQSNKTRIFVRSLRDPVRIMEETGIVLRPFGKGWIATPPDGMETTDLQRMLEERSVRADAAKTQGV